ncbi:hypothetical protein RQP46_001248 [Phenoliferia psychrophenolica]
MDQSRGAWLHDKLGLPPTRDSSLSPSSANVAVWLLVPSSTGPHSLKAIVDRLSPSSHPTPIIHIHLQDLPDASHNLPTTLLKIKQQVDAFKAEEMSRRQAPVDPIPKDESGPFLLISPSGDPLVAPNPFYDADWYPSPFAIPFVRLTPVHGRLVLELESTIEYRSLLGALSVQPPSDTRMWEYLFKQIRNPAAFECGAPAIVLGPGDNAVVEVLRAEGAIMEGMDGALEVGGGKEVSTSTLVVMKGGEEEGWVEVARHSVF